MRILSAHPPQLPPGPVKGRSGSPGAFAELLDSARQPKLHIPSIRASAPGRPAGQSPKPEDRAELSPIVKEVSPPSPSGEPFGEAPSRPATSAYGDQAAVFGPAKGAPVASHVNETQTRLSNTAAGVDAVSPLGPWSSRRRSASLAVAVPPMIPTPLSGEAKLQAPIGASSPADTSARPVRAAMDAAPTASLVGPDDAAQLAVASGPLDPLAHASVVQRLRRLAEAWGVRVIRVFINGRSVAYPHLEQGR